LKRAVTTYRWLKPFFARGRFIGIEPLVHGVPSLWDCHALPEQGAAVFVHLNLGSE
jgi:hypothetical protein